MKDIQSISEKVKTGEIEIKKGELPRMCWREFMERYKKKANLSKDDIAMKHMSTLDISNLLKPELMRMLEQEIVYLKSLK